MKILYVLDSLGTGGAERSTANLWYFLRDQGTEIKVVALRTRDEGIQEEILNSGFDVQFLKSLRFLAQVSEIMSVISEFKPDLVHSVLWNSNLRCRAARLRTNFLHVESLVNTTYTKERLQDRHVNRFSLSMYKFLDRITASRCVDRFHAISRSVKEHYTQVLGLPEERIDVVFRGRSAPTLGTRDWPFVSETHNGNPTLRIVSMGRQEYQKGQIYLLKAVKELCRKGCKLKLKLLGRSGAETNSLREFVQKNSLLEIVEFIGHVSNVNDYLLDSDLFVFPSLYEGLGCAMIEATAAGLPIVANDIPVLREVGEENVNTIFTDVTNTEKFSDAIAYFYENPKQIANYGNESFKLFTSRFSEQTSHNGMQQFYERAIELKM